MNWGQTPDGTLECATCGCTEPDYLNAMHAAQAGECSHGGHGWDGDSCTDIRALRAYSPEREAQARADLIVVLHRRGGPYACG